MKTNSALLLLLLSFSSFILHPSSFRAPSSLLAAPAGQPKVRVGSTADECRKVLGKPAHVARQLLYQRCREQWLYEKPQPLCLVFDWQRGQVPRLLDIQSLAPPRR